MDHHRVEVRFEQERFGPKADVCWECSDPDNRVWVPVSFCASASRTMPGWGEVDMELGFYTVPNAPSMWDEPEYDPLDKWDCYAR
jgi:hypothetical protein